MTALVGVACSGKVWIGADSAATDEADGQWILRDPKVFRRGAYLIAFCGAGRWGALLRHVVSLPSPVGDLDRIMAVDLADAMIKACKTSAYELPEDCGALIGVRGRLYVLENDLAATRLVDRHAAVGSGCHVAMGSLYSTRRLAPRTRVRTALEAAERCVSSVRRPFRILST